MKVVGIETSCDETAVAIVENGRKIISNIIASQIKDHEIYGGVVPEIASRKHLENITLIFKTALKKANCSLNDIDLIATTNTPGLVGALLVGVNFAKGISFSLKKPLVAVNHLKAHIAANYISNNELTPPFLALIISGGHTNIVRVKNYCEFELIGKTIDDSVGECFDKVGRELGFSYPAGCRIDAIAKNGDDTKYNFPKPKIKDNKFNFSFSGIKTAALNILKKEKKVNNADFSASFQKNITEILTEKVFAAIDKFKEKKLAVCGGVAANSKIRSSLLELCEKLKIEFFTPTINLCTDNAAMVASQGFFEFENGCVEKNFKLNAISSYNF